MIENRKAYRLPFRAKFVIGTKDIIRTGNATNISSGGAFIMSLEPFPRDTKVKCLFMLKPDSLPISVNAVVKRVVASTPNLEEMPGLGLTFTDLPEQIAALIQDFMIENRKNFELAATLLMSGEPDLNSLEPLLEQMHLPPYSDFGELKFLVERILKSIELVDKSTHT